MNELKSQLDRREKGIDGVASAQAIDEDFLAGASDEYNDDGNANDGDDDDGANAETSEHPAKSKNTCFKNLIANLIRCMTVWLRECGRLFTTQTLLHLNFFLETQRELQQVAARRRSFDQCRGHQKTGRNQSGGSFPRTPYSGVRK